MYFLLFTVFLFILFKVKVVKLTQNMKVELIPASSESMKTEIVVEELQVDQGLLSFRFINNLL